MGKEVFVVRLVWIVFENMDFDHEVYIRGVFDSMEKARACCEDLSSYPDFLGLDEYPESDKPLTWDEDGIIYSVLEYQDTEFPEDKTEIFFKIETHVLQ